MGADRSRHSHSAVITLGSEIFTSIEAIESRTATPSSVSITLSGRKAPQIFWPSTSSFLHWS